MKNIDTRTVFYKLNCQIFLIIIFKKTWLVVSFVSKPELLLLFLYEGVVFLFHLSVHIAASNRCTFTDSLLKRPFNPRNEHQGRMGKLIAFD